METALGSDPAATVEAARLIAKGLTMTVALGGAAVGQGILIGKGLEAIGRNPEQSGNIFGKMIIGAAITEAAAIYALVGFFIL